jgi:hypothetical protein
MADAQGEPPAWFNYFLGTTRKKVAATALALGTVVAAGVADGASKVISRIFQSNFKSVTGIDPDQELSVLNRQSIPAVKPPETFGSIPKAPAAETSPLPRDANAPPTSSETLPPTFQKPSVRKSSAPAESNIFTHITQFFDNLFHREK